MKKKHRTLVPAAAAVLTFSVSACSTSSADTSADGASSTATTPSAGASAGGTSGGPGGAGFPGADGEVAAVQGDVLQVQSAMSGQVAVILTDSTAITTEVSSSLDQLRVGSCVTVVVGAADSSSGSPAEAATTVRISEKVDGECTGDGGFGGGQRGDRPEPLDAPSDTPSDMPSGAPGDVGRGGVVAGEVTALDDAGFTVAAVSMGAPGEDSGDATTTDVTVAVGEATTFTTTEDGTTDDIAVGRCVSARGEADDTGAVTAEAVSVRDKVDGECSGGFGGGFGGGSGGLPGNDRSSSVADDKDAA